MSSLSTVRGFLESKINERRSREGILKLRERKFRKILKYAFKNSPFYRELYASKGITEEDLDTIDIEKLPTVDKEMIVENFDRVVTAKDLKKGEILDFLENDTNPEHLFKNKYHVAHSSGSSGKIGIFVYSKNEWDYWVPYITRGFKFNFRKLKTSYLGATKGHYGSVSFVASLKRGLAKYFCEPCILDINQPIDEVVKKLNDFQPDILGGYFTGLKILAQCQKDGKLKVHPKFIENCAEGILPKDKEFIESVFNAPLVNLYGPVECVLVGIGKNEWGGIYLFDDIALVEIKEDHILLTNLYNYTQPIIRYRIDDYLKEKKDEKKILPFTMVESIIGREEFVPWFENDDGEMDFIHPFIFVEFFVKGLDKFQIVVKDKKSFDFLAVIKDENKEDVIRRIGKKLDSILKDKKFTSVKYSIKEVDDLRVDEKTGKFRLIIKK